MGLDNGLVVKIKDKKSFGSIPERFKKDIFEVDSIEMSYWRKCWNVRSLMFDVLNAKRDSDTYEFIVSADELKQFNKELKKYCRDEDWCLENQIWSIKTFRKICKDNIKNSRRIMRWLKTKPEDSYEIIFYDSY